MDLRAPPSRHRRSDRYRQILAGLRARQQGLPRWLFAPLRARAPLVRRSRPGAWRRSSCTPDRGAGARQSTHPRRLGPEALTADQRRDLLEIVDDRYDKASLLITSQAPVAQWHDVIADPTFGDAILDRIIHNAHRIELKGDSVRRWADDWTAA